jgi:hypothetical protein
LKKEKKQNTTKCLVDENGIKHEDHDGMCDVVLEYFTKLFTTEISAHEENVLDGVQRKVTAEMNIGLLAPFTEEEIRKALFSIGDLKAPDPNGLHAIFYKRFWDLLGDDLIKAVLFQRYGIVLLL